MSIHVLQPGLLTTVQDLGRTGQQQFGIPVAGAMDPRSAALANILVGNPQSAAVLECTLMGPRLQFDSPVFFAITGGDLSPALDGVPIPMYRTMQALPGQVLSFGTLRTGCRSYLACYGGIDVPLVMGSRSTYLKAAIGGFQGRPLKAGDRLPVGRTSKSLPNLNNRHLSPEFIPRPIYTLRVVMGPQDDAFTAAGISTFLTQTYSLTNECDRMGYRLDGPPIQHRTSANIISDGMVFGAIQVPDSGNPIIMLADRQTIGGYTKIAAVISADFRLLGQLKTGDRVRFESVSIQEAQEALIAQRKALHLLESVFRNHTSAHTRPGR